MQRHSFTFQTAFSSLWGRCFLIALTCLQVIAPSWHICSMGASHPADHQFPTASHRYDTAMPMPENISQVSNYYCEDYCLARTLQHVLANNQFRLLLDFASQEIAVLKAANIAIPASPSFVVLQARAPPAFA